MKKILLACGALLLLAPAGFAQNRQQQAAPIQHSNRAAKVMSQRKTGSMATISYTPAAHENATPQTAEPAVQTSPDIIVPDHAYQPEGTAGVGFFGNGTGGSTIGSTPPDGGTGYTPARTPAGNMQPLPAQPQERSESK